MDLAKVLSDSVIHRTVGVIVSFADTGAGRVCQQKEEVTAHG
jgi:hypothetical protein